jgi:hypothetical protein
MTITPEQRTYARLAGILFLMNYVLQGAGDYVTIIARGGETFAQTARYATDHTLLWRVSLLNVGLSWIDIGVLGFALYAVLEPVNQRLAQLALVLRLGASFVGAASMMFRVAKSRLYSAWAKEGLFTPEQLSTLSSVAQNGANAGVWIAWILLGAGSVLTFVLFLRSRYVPRVLAGFGIVTCALFMLVVPVMFVFPERSNPMKGFGLPAFFAEVATALWILIKGLPQQGRA